MQTLLFLQKLGVSRQAIQDLAVDAKLPFALSWEDWRRVDSPADVFAIITVQAAVDDDILDRFPNLRMVAVAFTGYDCLDLEACGRRGIAVYNVPAYSTDSVAELALALVICLLREIPRADRQVRAGGWRLDRSGTELAGRTVGILGTGAIGLRVAELFKACKCNLIGWSRTEREEFTGLGGVYVSREVVLSEADVVSIHLPLSADTEGIIGPDELELMKPGGCLINTARGRIVDQIALAHAVREGRIRAAVDVFDPEPVPADHPLLQCQDTVFTPHLAFQTGEALRRRAQVTIQNIRGFLDGQDENRIA